MTVQGLENPSTPIKKGLNRVNDSLVIRSNINTRKNQYHSFIIYKSTQFKNKKNGKPIIPIHCHPRGRYLQSSTTQNKGIVPSGKSSIWLLL